MRYETVTFRVYLDSSDLLGTIEVYGDQLGADGFCLKGIIQHPHVGSPAAILIYERPVPESFSKIEPPAYDARNWFAEGWIAERANQSLPMYLEAHSLHPTDAQYSLALEGWNYSRDHQNEGLPKERGG